MQKKPKKVSLKNVLINNSNAATNCIPEKASWLIDSLADVQSLKSKDTSGKWIKSFMHFITPPEVAECLLVGMVNDTYQKPNTKNNTRNQKGEYHIKTAIEGFEQYMPTGMKWNEFLRNAENKKELINLIVKFIKSNKSQQLINSIFTVTTGDKIYRFQEGQEVNE